MYVNPKCTIDDVDAIGNGSRVLHIYGVVAYTEWQGWLKSTYRSIQPAYEPELPDNRVLSALYGMMTSVSDVDHHLVDRAILAITLYVDGKCLDLCVKYIS